MVSRDIPPNVVDKEQHLPRAIFRPRLEISLRALRAKQAVPIDDLPTPQSVMTKVLLQNIFVTRQHWLYVLFRLLKSDAPSHTKEIKDLPAGSIRLSELCAMNN